MEIFKKIPKIKELPDDNITRVVFAHEGIYYNWKNSSIPLAGVLLVEVEVVNGEEQLSDKYIIVKIGVPEVDSARYGTMFLGTKRLKRNWKGYDGYQEALAFNFNFTENEPTSVHFGDRDSDGKYYIPYGRFSFSMIDDKFVKIPFMKTQLTKLITDEGITVFIPALEVLTSLLVPSDRVMRSKLLMSPMDDVLRKYLKKHMYDSVNDIYVLEFKDQGKRNSSTSFLAYLAMNQKSRNRVSKIGASVFVGDKTDIKYPEILPYHPETLSILADGIWLDDEETSFLCFRVDSMKLPNDHKIGRIVEKEIKVGEELEEQEGGDGGRNPSGQMPPGLDPEVTAGNNPNTGGKTTYIKTEVEIINDDDIFVNIVVENEVDEPQSPPVSSTNDETEDNEDDEIEDPEEDENASNQLSSGEEENSQDSKGTSKLRQKDNLIKNPKERVKNSDILKNMIFTLDALRKDASSILSNFQYIDSNGAIVGKGTLFDFTASRETKHKKWAYNVYDKENDIYEGRGALIIKITLSNKKSAYIFEIERRNDNEGFFGQLFNTENGKLSTNQIEKLLLEVEKNNGRAKKRAKRLNSEGEVEGFLKTIPLESVIENIPYEHTNKVDETLYKEMFEKLLAKEQQNSIFK